MKPVAIFFLVLLSLPSVVDAKPELSCQQGNAALLYSTAQVIEDYKSEKEQYPRSLADLKAPYYYNMDLSGQTPFYAASTDGKSFELISLGCDGQKGTADDIRFDPAKRADNTLPMFGGIDVVKTAFQMEADEEFIQTVTKKGTSREQGSVIMVGYAWEFFKKGDLATAMKRFNQAWLLNPTNPDIYQGFAAILRTQGKMVEAERILKITR